MEVNGITEEDSEVIAEILEKHSTYDCDYSYSEKYDRAFFLFSEVSWDDPTDALKEVSQQFSDKVFEMAYVGDEWDDRGSVYAKNGRTQTCHIIVSYEEPDEFFK
jgi:hypothetical protein